MIGFANAKVGQTGAPAAAGATQELRPAVSQALRGPAGPVPRYEPLAQTGGILVTGSHRSGTTWVGRMLATAPKVDYIHEPFKPGWALPYTFTRSDLWFPYIAAHNGRAWEQDTLRTLRFEYSWRQKYAEAPSVRQAWTAASKWARWNSRRVRGHRPLIKDPIALFAAPWLADRFGVDVVVMIRHPAAFVSSIKLKRWRFDWTHWTRQPELMQTLLAPFAADIEARTHNPAGEDLVDQAILQWRVFHHVIDVYRSARPDWLFVRHEDLSLDPVGGYREMFGRLGLSWTPACEAIVRQSSDEGNLKDAAAAGKSTHFVQLDAKANVRNWQQRLSAEEVARVRRGTEDVSPLFYTDEDWA